MKLIKSSTIIGLFSLVILSFGTLEGAEILLKSDTREKLTVKLEEDEVAILGFGSLMLEETLHCSEEVSYSRPYIMARLKGFKRSWSIQYPNNDYFEDENGVFFKPETTTCLNIERCEDSIMNGMLFVCSKAELESYDDREWPYDRIEINDFLEDVAVIGGKAYVYIAKPENFRPAEEMSSTETVISEYYIYVIEAALKRLGEDFSKEYYESTQPVPMHLVFNMA